MAKIAVIINGDSEARHLGNVERALKHLEAKGYETWVASPQKPQASHDFYFQSSAEGMKKFIAQLEKQNKNSNNELVIYTTGHGSQDGACIADNHCQSHDLFSRLDRLPYSQRTIVMDQCYGGNWGKQFLDDPKTLFISNGSKDEEVFCEEFAIQFWGTSGLALDKNGDGVVDWQERYAAAVASPLSTEPRFVSSQGYRLQGKGTFPSKVLDVADKKALDQQLKRLKPGQYAIITFSSKWCDACKEYAPLFNQMAQKSSGQLLWLRTENESLGLQNGVRYPLTVFIIDHHGFRREVEDRNAIAEALAQFSLLPEEMLEVRITRTEKMLDHKIQVDDFVTIACDLAKIHLKKRAGEVFEKAIASAEEIKDDKERVWALKYTADMLVNCQFEERGKEIYEKAMAVAEKLEDGEYLTFALESEYAVALSQLNMKERAGEIFKKALTTAEKMRDYRTWRSAILRLDSCLNRANLERDVMEFLTARIKQHRINGRL